MLTAFGGIGPGEQVLFKPREIHEQPTGIETEQRGAVNTQGKTEGPSEDLNDQTNSRRRPQC